MGSISPIAGTEKSWAAYFAFLWKPNKCAILGIAGEKMIVPEPVLSEVLKSFFLTFSQN